MYRYNEEEFRYRYMYSDKQGTCLQYLPKWYPAAAGAAAITAAEDLRRRIEKTQRVSAEGGGCKGARVVVAKDRPDAGMGVKLVHLAANLVGAVNKLNEVHT